MKFDLKETAREKLMLVAHRGMCAGNVPCNTIAAYEAALAYGADMIEIDIARTSDGKLIVFHPGMERPHLGICESLARLPWDFVRQLRYLNMDDKPTQFSIHTLDEVLETFKGRCYINTDKFWTYPREISDAIRAHGMTEQILVKTGVKREYLDIIEEFCPDMQYMAIAATEADIAAARARKLRYVGTEVLFKDDASPLASPAFIEKQHAEGLLLWCNAIVYDHRKVLAGGHSDDRAFLGDQEGSWGWIADRGFDFLQTDHIALADRFLAETGRRLRGGRPC